MATTHLQIESDPFVQDESCCPPCPEGGPVESHPTPEQLARDAMLDDGFDPFVESPEEYIRRTALERHNREVNAAIDAEIPTWEEAELALVTLEEIRTEEEWLAMLTPA